MSRGPHDDAQSRSEPDRTEVHDPPTGSGGSPGTGWNPPTVPPQKTEFVTPAAAPERTEFVSGPHDEKTEFVTGPGGEKTEFVAGPDGGERTEFVQGPGGGDKTEYVPGPDGGERTEYVPGPEASGPDPSGTRSTDDLPPGVSVVAPGAPGRTHGPAGEVTVLTGPRTGETYALEPKTTFGRSPDCTITLHDGTVSAVHGVLIEWGRRTMLLDWDSKGGTTVNGARIQRAFLRDGDRIGFAGAQLQFHAGESASSWVMAIPWVVLGLGALASAVYLTRGLWGG